MKRETSLNLSLSRLETEEPDKLREDLENNPHLLEYVAGLPPEGKTKYVSKLTYQHRKIPFPDIIYPVGGSVFVHVYPTLAEEYNIRYHVIEPVSNEEQKNILEWIEERLIDLAEREVIPEGYEERKKTFESLIRRAVTIGNFDEKVSKGFRGLLSNVREGKKTITLTERTFQIIKYLLEKERVGFSSIEALMRDPYIEDISCDGIGNVFLLHRTFRGIETDIQFASEDELNRFVVELSDRVGIPVSHRRPIMDTVLPDGSRLNIVFGKDVSRKGSNFTIRKFPKIPMSVADLVKERTITAQIAAYMWILIKEGVSFFVIGETASGKTTTIAALTTFIRPGWKVVSIEESPEVYLPHKNWVQQIIRVGGETETEVGMYDLLRAALRQRPNYIIPSEIRGKEGFVIFQAIQTGHPCISTVHADTMGKLFQRLHGDPINVPKTSIGNVEVVLIQRKVYDAMGNVRRIVVSVNEIMGYDSEADVFNYIPIFFWDPANDVFVFRGHGNSYLLNTKIAQLRGIPDTMVGSLYDELDKRAKLLECMAQMGTLNFFNVWEVIQKVEDRGINRISNIEEFLRECMRKA